MAKGKKGKKGKKSESKPTAPKLTPGHFFTGSSLLAVLLWPSASDEPPTEKGHGKKAKGKKHHGDDDGEEKTSYGQWDDEMYITSADGLYPGKMIVVDEEAIQVLQVTAGGAKKATKLLVKRACMGTRPTAHSFHAPVLAMPHMASYRPGTSPAPIILSTASIEDIINARNPEKDTLVRVPSTTCDGERAGEEEKGEEETDVSGRPPRVTEWFRASRQDLRAGLLVRYKSGAVLDGIDAGPNRCSIKSNVEPPAIQDALHELAESRPPEMGWKPVFPYTTSVHPYSVLTQDMMRRSALANGVASSQLSTSPVANSLAPRSAPASSVVQHEQMLMYAIKHNHLDTVRQLLEQGLSANMLCKAARSKSQPKTSMLMLSAKGGHAEMAQLLLEHNADVMQKDDKDETALNIAKNCLASAQHDLDAKLKAAAVKARQAVRNHYSAQESRNRASRALPVDHGSPLASAGANVTSQPAWSRAPSVASASPLASAAQMGARKSPLGGARAVTDTFDTEVEENKLLDDGRIQIQKYADTIQVLRQGYATLIRRHLPSKNAVTQKSLKDLVLRLAIEEGWVDVAEAVLDSGISPNHAFSVQRPGCSDWISAPCIQLAALHGHAPIVELLLRRHASVNVTDVDGCTLLMDTARSGSAECARLLLGAGAKLDVIGPNGSAAKMAVAHSNAPVLSVLLDAGARIGDKNSLGQDCVLKAWTMVHGVNGQANMNGTKKSAAAETLEVFHTLFGRLASTGRGGTVDAYCYLCLGATSAGPWHRGLRTTIRRNSTCPVWKEQLEVLSPTQGEADFISMFLKVEVWDWDQVGDEMLIGTVIQSLEVVSSQPNATLASVFSLAANFRHNASHSPADKSPSQSSARSPDLTPSENKSCSSTRSPAQLSRQKVMRELFCGHLTMKLKLRPGAVIVDVESAQSLMQQDRETKEIGDCLKVAALVGWCDVIEACVISRKADLDIQIDGARKCVPLMYAAAAQQSDALEMLLEYDADANLGDAEGATPLMWACATRVRYPGNPKMNSDTEASLDQRERRLCEVLMKYATCAFEARSNGDPRAQWEAQEYKSEHDRMMRSLTQMYPGVTLLRHKTVELLLKHGANPRKQDAHGRDAMHYLTSDTLAEDLFFRLEWLWR